MGYFAFGGGSFGNWKNGCFLARNRCFSEAFSPKNSPKTLQNRKNHEKIK